MKQLTKIALIVAVLSIALGLVLVLCVLANTGIDAEKMNTINFEVKTHTVTDSFSSIEIRGTECDISILPTDGVCTVECDDSEKITTVVKAENNVLTITRTDDREWYEHIGVFYYSPKIVLYLPECEYENLYIESISGDVDISSEFSFSGTAEVVSTSGNIIFMCNAQNLGISSTSGDIKVGTAAADSADISSTSGSVSISAMSVNGIHAATTSGDIRIDDVVSTNTIELAAVSGDIEFDRCDAGMISISTVSGDVEGELLSPKNFEAETVSGDIRLPKSDYSAGMCYISTTSGDIDIDVA